MSSVAPSLRRAPSGPSWQQIKKAGPLTLIILLHVGFFYGLQSGLLRQAVQAMPKEVFASFITPEPPPKPEPPKAQPAPPKTVPIVKQTVTRPPPVAPVVNQTPSEQAISLPAAQPESPAPVAIAAPVVAPPAPPVPPAPAPAQPKTITSGAEYLQTPRPEYPQLSRRMGEEGKVMLRVLINDKGRPEHVEVSKSSGVPRLDEAARQAVLRAVFKPYVEDGRAIPVYVSVPINFQLNT